MKKKARVNLLERIAKDERSTKRGPVCRVCVSKQAKEIDADLREYHQLKIDGVQCSFAWLVETHFLEHYGFKSSRQACQRHMTHHLGLK